MSMPSSSQSSASLYKQAYEINMTAYASALAETGGGYVQRDSDAVLSIFPYTFWSNGIMSPQFTEENVIERIDQVLEVFRKHKREVWFHIGPSSSPVSLAEQLKARGLWNFHNRPFMVCDLRNLVTNYPQPGSIQLRYVEEYRIIKTFPHPIHGLVTTPRKNHIFQTYIMLDREIPRRHWMFVAEDKGVPIASTILFLDHDIGGIYDVEVQKAYRGRGIGSALLQHTCYFARDTGARVAALAASEQGSKFYPRFGFRKIGRYPTYYYSLKKQKLDAEWLKERW